MCLRGEVLQPLELEFRIVTGVLGSEPRSSARWVHALTRLLPSPLPETVMQMFFIRPVQRPGVLGVSEEQGRSVVMVRQLL